jgi:hypothetical protein
MSLRPPFEIVDWSKYEGKSMSIYADCPESRLVRYLLANNLIPHAVRSKKPRGTLRQEKAKVKKLRNPKK